MSVVACNNTQNQQTAYKRNSDSDKTAADVVTIVDTGLQHRPRNQRAPAPALFRVRNVVAHCLRFPFFMRKQILLLIFSVLHILFGHKAFGSSPSHLSPTRGSALYPFGAPPSDRC